MKKYVLMALSVLLSGSIQAQEYNIDTFESRSLPQNSVVSFWSIDGHYDYIFDSKFNTAGITDQKISFQQGGILLSWNKMLNACDGFAIGVGYSYTNLDWEQNPSFSQKNFHDAVLSVSASTHRIPCWEWQANFTLSVDAEEWDFCDYATYTFALWGRYEWCPSFCPDLGVHLGFIGRTGLEDDLVLPILGVDFTFCNCWEVNLIFPQDISLIYHYDCNWSFFAAGKYWNSRHRVGKNEPLSRGIFEYRNIGAEVGVAYECGEWLEANFHVGSTICRSELEISDRNDKNNVERKFKQAPYVGAAAIVRF